MTTFPTHAVLSCSTGRLMGDIGGVYSVTSFILGRDVYTHELPYYGDAVRTALRSVHPALPGPDDFEHVNAENVRAVRSEWEQRLGGAEFELDDALRDVLADERNTLDVLREMKPSANVVAIKLQNEK